MTSTKEPVNLAELASEVVRMMINDRSLTVTLATMELLAIRGIDYGESSTIARLARETIHAKPEIARTIRHYRQDKSLSPACRGHMGFSARAIERNEESRPVYEEPPAPPESLPDGQYILRGIITAA